MKNAMSPLKKNMGERTNLQLKIISIYIFKWLELYLKKRLKIY